ncbi:MAG: hypothetical protein IT317_16065 [Anaerolineales bacterium]|nr:hypothetical protein [Anaerolineales bacterium]
MSGFAGLVYFDGRAPAPDALAPAEARLLRRGPDAGGAWHAGPAALTQRVLFTTPESLAEAGPLASADGACMIVADARLDNRAELCGQLALRDDGQPDAALILAAYQRWGADCAAQLLGDFAFAIWDTARREVLLARDIMGVRPVFYYHSRAFCAFASDVQALRSIPGVPSRLNEAHLADYLTGGVDAAQSFYADLPRVPPAHTVTLSAAGPRLSRYWDLDAARDTRLPNDDEYAAAFRERITASVRARLRSAFPVGSMLSGGLDSTSVVCLARPMLAERGERLHTFSLLFDAARASDEREFMAPAVALGGLEHHTLLVDPASPLTDLERLLDLSGEPFVHMALSLQHQANSAARAAGVRVLLDGNYGDAVVSHGLGRLTELLRAGRLRTAWREFTGMTGGWQPRRTRALAGMAWSMALKPLMPEFMRQGVRGWRRLRQPDRPYWAAGTPINPSFAWRLDSDTALRAHIEARARRFRDTRAENRFSLAKLPAMPELYNRIAADPGIDLRHPYLDRRLIEFCLGLPAEQRLRDGWNRLIQRNAMRGILPEAVRQRRSKSSPIFSIGRALLANDMPRLAELMPAVAISAPYVDLAVTRADYAQLQQAAALGEYTVPRHWNPMLRLSRVLTFSLWLAAAEPAVFDTSPISA